MTPSTTAAPIAANTDNTGHTDNIATVAQLRAGGLSERAIATRCRPGGPWRRLLPGVVLLAATEPTRRQLLRAASCHYGREGVLTGVDALMAHGLDLPRPRRIHVLVPSYRRTLPPEFVLLERTRRPPDPVSVHGLPFAPPARAALDAARRTDDPDLLHDLLTLPVLEGLCDLDQLRAELDAGNQRGSSAVRSELRRLAQNRDSYVHGMARRLLLRSPLPPPRWNTTVCDLRGRPIGFVDAWWDELGLGWQLIRPAAEESHGRLGHLALTAAGVVVLRTSVERLRDAPGDVVRELASAFRTASQRPRPQVQCEVPGVAA
ncbi:hypothetical protein B0I33_11416 [Prauserella shujinwangii]|uniref:AbiEi antitoxin C-terminal domain-containing protein n=1 Tax=Prauserella shujinwangii TaxID=1453103 RepID=A0A2T0LKT1_9PSEU|nr:hypothetical protein [Prauserella shujinwangii]PRX43559.1 hypothetical protein B0I33_11416 [Prauserella shujinwangii]